MSVRQPNAGSYRPYGNTDQTDIDVDGDADGDSDATTYPSFLSFHFVSFPLSC
jgi:hypothetical protein